MFGKSVLNGKQLCNRLGMSTTLLYRLLDSGMPYHRLTKNSRRYYNLEEVKDWLLKVGYHQENRLMK